MKRLRSQADCPYLDTIDRSKLDFDFEKVCSVTLKHVNVYGCLVCGKYFQGRGTKTPAYTHSLDAGHHMFINVDNGRVFCLPDLYEVVDRSLDDIKLYLNTVYSGEDVKELDHIHETCRKVDGSAYVRGFPGIGSIPGSDGIVSVVLLLLRIRWFRNFFLTKEANPEHGKLLNAISDFSRRLFSAHCFKGQVSPHVLLYTISEVSQGRFFARSARAPSSFISKKEKGSVLDVVSEKQEQNPSDVQTAQTSMFQPDKFLSFLLNEINVACVKNHMTSPVKKYLRGSLFVRSVIEENKLLSEDKTEGLEKEAKSPFLFLGLELPPNPLFKDVNEEKSILPQVSLLDLLDKYNGETSTSSIRGNNQTVFSRYSIIKLPPVLIFYVKRLEINRFTSTINETIVQFPVESLDMSPYSNGGGVGPVLYDLVSLVSHSGSLRDGSYFSCGLDRSSGMWYETDNLSVRSIPNHRLSSKECVLLCYERKPS